LGSFGAKPEAIPEAMPIFPEVPMKGGLSVKRLEKLTTAIDDGGGATEPTNNYAVVTNRGANVFGDPARSAFHSPSRAARASPRRRVRARSGVAG
jgi:hypothetical protein